MSLKRQALSPATFWYNKTQHIVFTRVIKGIRQIDFHLFDLTFVAQTDDQKVLRRTVS